jgi:hypothetical protein
MSGAPSAPAPARSAPAPTAAPGPAAGSDASGTRRAIVGAIRWDAWIGDAPGSDVGRQVERSLGPKRWRYRLPFYAKELPDGAVEVRANTASVMDREIAYAHGAGLDYWAFVLYDASSPLTRGGLELYLQSQHAAQLHFCLIAERFRATDIPRVLGYFSRPSYQRVGGGRPLLFLLGPSDEKDPAFGAVSDAVKALREATTAAGVPNPYLVHLWGGSQAAELADALGADAIGAYNLEFDDAAAPYSVLAAKTQAKWDEWLGTGKHVVPLATTGWDRRPRVENPVSWEEASPKDAMNRFYEPPTPDELASHVGAALHWVGAHHDAVDSDSVLIYAWNEFDEGGWLVPGLLAEQGTKRLDAIARALAP